MPEYYSRAIIIANSVGPFFATAAVGLRIAMKRRSKVAFGADDLMVIIALVCLVALAITNIYAGTTNCFDQTLPDISAIEQTHMYAFVEVMLGLTVNGTSKATIVLFCKRIFTTRDFTIAANIILAVIFGWTVSGLLTQVFSAHPINTWWTSILPNFTINWKVSFIYIGASSAVLDIVAWLLPVIFIRRLHMSSKRKVLLSSLFAVGLLCTITAAVRLYYAVVIYRVLNFEIPLDNLLASTAWSSILTTIETSLSVVLVCLLTFGPLFRRSAKPKPSTKTFHSEPTSQGTTARSQDTQTLSFDEHDAEIGWPLPHLPPASPWRLDYLSQSNQSTTTCAAQPVDTVAKETQSDRIVVEKSFGFHIEDFSSSDNFRL